MAKYSTLSRDKITILKASINPSKDNSVAEIISIPDRDCFCFNDSLLYRTYDLFDRSYASRSIIFPLAYKGFSREKLNIISNINISSKRDASIDSRYSSGFIRVSNQNNCDDNKNLKINSAIYLKEAFYKKYQSIGGNISAAYQRNNRCFIFYEKNENICALMTTDDGTTWFDFNNLIRLKRGERVSDPYVIQDNKNDNVYLLFLLNEKILCCKEINLAHFLIDDAFVNVGVLSEWDKKTNDDSGLEMLTTYGKAIRKGSFVIIAGDYRYINNVENEIEISQERIKNKKSYRFSLGDSFDNLKEEITHNTIFSGYKDNRGRLVVWYILNTNDGINSGKWNIRVSFDYVNWKLVVRDFYYIYNYKERIDGENKAHINTRQYLNFNQFMFRDHRFYYAGFVNNNSENEIIDNTNPIVKSINSYKTNTSLRSNTGNVNSSNSTYSTWNNSDYSLNPISCLDLPVSTESSISPGFRFGAYPVGFPPNQGAYNFVGVITTRIEQLNIIYDEKKDLAYILCIYSGFLFVREIDNSLIFDIANHDVDESFENYEIKDNKKPTKDWIYNNYFNITEFSINKAISITYERFQIREQESQHPLFYKNNKDKKYYIFPQFTFNNCEIFSLPVHNSIRPAGFINKNGYLNVVYQSVDGLKTISLGVNPLLPIKPVEKSE